MFGPYVVPFLQTGRLSHLCCVALKQCSSCQSLELPTISSGSLANALVVVSDFSPLGAMNSSMFCRDRSQCSKMRFTMAVSFRSASAVIILS